MVKNIPWEVLDFWNHSNFVNAHKTVFLLILPESVVLAYQGFLLSAELRKLK
jgi:hypothetical protein